jgi:hypothetical protein
VCAVIAGRQEAEEPDLDAKAAAVDQAVSVAVAAADAVAGPTA